MKAPNWTSAEDETLRKHRKFSIAVLRELLPHRTKLAISQRRCFLGVHKPSGEEWTEEEIRILKETAHLPQKDVFRLLNKKRTLVSIAAKRKKLGIGFSCRRRWNKEELSFIRNNYGDMSLEEMSVKMGRSVEGIRKKALKIYGSTKITEIGELCSPNRAAIEYGITHRTVHRWIATGKLQAKIVTWNNRVVKLVDPAKVKKLAAASSRCGKDTAAASRSCHLQ